jgi:hypothetical protein
LRIINEYKSLNKLKMMLLILYFTLIYVYAFSIANKKANEDYGWNVQLVVTALIMPVAIPVAVAMGIHSFLEGKLRF